MSRIVLNGKIHTARLTQCELDYEGSLEIDFALMQEAGILPYEKILVVNRRNGARLETYAIPGPAGSKVFCMNGPAAHRGAPGDVITIMAFAVVDDAAAEVVVPKIIVLDENNNIAERKGRKPNF
jgi:aspartate 1-decarboxylase